MNRTYYCNKCTAWTYDLTTLREHKSSAHRLKHKHAHDYKYVEVIGGVFKKFRCGCGAWKGSKRGAPIRAFKSWGHILFGKSARVAVLILIAISGVGCRGLNRLIDGEPGEAPPYKVISDAPDVSTPPTFDVPQPANTTKIVYYNVMPASHQVAVTASQNATVDVFVKDFSGAWFKLNTTNSSGYVYRFDAAAGVVEYWSRNPQLNLSLMKLYCVYQYVPEVQP